MKKLFLSIIIVMAYLSAMADNSVTVAYNGSAATVTVDDNVAQYLTVTQSGAHVSIAQSDDLAQEITYTLSGTSTDGEFYMSGSYKATIELNGLTLTNATPVYSGAAIHVQNGKRINVKVITGTTNTLVDAASGEQKGCLYIKGHAEFKQYGTLNIVGNVKHGIKAGEYVSIKNATINVTSAVGDGISCNEYFLMESGTVSISGTGDDGVQADLDGDTSTGMTPNHEDEDSGNIYIEGGSITIETSALAAKGIKSAGDMYISGEAVVSVTVTGNGTWDEDDLETKAASGLSADGNMNISDGTISLTATGSGGKGMKCDGVMNISGGDITVATSGGLYYSNGVTENHNYTGNTDNLSSNYYSSPKGIKAGLKQTSGNTTTYSGGMAIVGGNVSVTTSGHNGEGIESKNYLSITGGEITVESYDDGINSAQNMTITGGYVYSRGTNNDGIDANGNMYIMGGLIYAIGASSPELAIDVNSEEQKKLYFTGGTLIAVGGIESGSYLAQTCYRTTSITGNTWYSMTYGSTTIAFYTPSISGGGGGPGGGGPGGGGGSSMVISASSTPTLKRGVTVTNGTSLFDGKCYLNATVSGGSNVSLSQYSSSGSAPSSYTITASASPTAGGTVSGANTYFQGAVCTLVATANSGYTFVNWTRNGTAVSTDPIYSFSVTANGSYVANFEQETTEYTITATASPTAGGTVSGAGTYAEGATCTLVATANSGYTFSNWTLDGTTVSTNASYSFTVTGNAAYVANFEQDVVEYTITATASPTAGGTVSGAGTYAEGATCTLVATANSGYTFTNWTLDGTTVSTNATYSFTVTGNAAYVANFSLQQYTITVVASPSDGGIVAGGGTYYYGDHCTVTATPNNGYTFVNWTMNGTVVSDDPEYTFTVTQTATYTAVFATETYKITATVNPVAGGVITGAGTYSLGQTAELGIELAPNYVFVNWTEDGQVVAESPTYSFTVTGDRVLVANVQFVDGIEEGENVMVSVYPNPVSDKLTVETSEACRLVQVFNLNGTLVFSQNDCSEKVEIDMGHLANGTYLVRLVVGQSIVTKVVVK